MWYPRFAKRRGLNLDLPPGSRKYGKIHAYVGDLLIGEVVVTLCGEKASQGRCDFVRGDPLPHLRGLVCKKCLPAIEAEMVGKVLAKGTP